MVFLQVAENHLVAAEDDQDTTASLAKRGISANLTVAMATDISKSSGIHVSGYTRIL